MFSMETYVIFNSLHGSKEASSRRDYFRSILLQHHGSRVHKGESLRVLQYGDKSSETIHFYMKCGKMKCLSGLEMPGISIYKPSIAFFRVYTCNEKVIE